MPTDPNDPLSRQNIKDRYFGVNDPVASKMLNRASNMKVVVPPADPTLTTLVRRRVLGHAQPVPWRPAKPANGTRVLT